MFFLHSWWPSCLESCFWLSGLVNRLILGYVVKIFFGTQIDNFRSPKIKEDIKIPHTTKIPEDNFKKIEGE